MTESKINLKPVLLYAPNLNELKENLTTYFYLKECKLYKKKTLNNLNNLLNKHFDKVKYVMHYIYLTTVINKKEMCIDYVPISNAKFERLLGKRYYYEIMKFLKMYDYIEDDDHYVFDVANKEKGKCKGYRFKPQFYSKHRFVQEMVLNEDFERVLKLQRSENFSNSIDDITIRIEENLQRLSIRYDEAIADVIKKSKKEGIALEEKHRGKLQILENRINGLFIPQYVYSPDQADISAINAVDRHNAKFKKKKQLTPRLKEVKTIVKDIARYNTTISSRISSVDRLRHKTQSATRPVKGNRVHTNITNLASELRQYLYLEDTPQQQLISLDVSNSQPFALVKVILDYIDEYSYFIDESTALYISLVSKGNFYSYMKEKMNISENDKDFKQRMFGKIFYDKHSNCIHSEEWKVFKNLFPLVAVVIEDKKKDDYKALAVEMQRVEASVMIDKVLRELMEKYPDRFFTHIHDSIIFEAGMEDEVKSLMRLHYQSVTGYTPHIKAAEKVNKVEEKERQPSQVAAPVASFVSDFDRRFEALFESDMFRDFEAHKTVKQAKKAVSLDNLFM